MCFLELKNCSDILFLRPFFGQTDRERERKRKLAFVHTVDAGLDFNSLIRTDLTNLKQLKSLKNVFFKTRQIEFTRIYHILPHFLFRFVHSQNI